MKITFSVIFFNLFIITTTFPLLSTSSDLIYDSAGNKLLKGLPYYILPLLRGTGGGLTLSQTTKNTCPLNITQEPFEVNNGVPFIFTPIILDEQFVRGSYPTSIEADVQKDQNPCHGSNIWTVSKVNVAKDDDDDDDDARFKDHKDHKKKKHDDDDDDDDKKDFTPVSIVTTGGEFNKPESCFQIVEDDMMPGLLSYQIQYCPFKCGSSSTVLTCYNVGLISDADDKKYLGLTDAIFPVVFTNSFGTVKPAKTLTLSTFSRLSAKMTSFSRSAK
ncbi:kunitz trypsin inhibitor 1-like [Cynara cardunculus var. scolymus]|uniref:kunitz trypsin inhibitor 1-like n=1 Tax=Cynara cardunculus var. scolymus TaxID=59895 RepID=UPI000D62DAFA|nr:kunitz trypsin inhibitor 1-like [Cynara cardunculus var. scolymus]